jgi:hypothetical protein
MNIENDPELIHLELKRWIVAAFVWNTGCVLCCL